MSSTLLDVTRGAHEEVERLERLIVKDLQKEPATNKDRLYQNHRVSNIVNAIMSTTQKLIEIYEDKDHARKEEIAALGGASGRNVFNAFYGRLKEIREYHRRHPTAHIVDMLDDPEELLKEEPQIDFSGEEAFGRYLDIHELYNEYVNSKFGQLIDYSAFLEEFAKTHNVDHNHKLKRQYKEYLTHLLDYFIYKIFLKVVLCMDGRINGEPSILQYFKSPSIWIIIILWMNWLSWVQKD